MANLSGDNGGLDATMLVQPSGGYGYGGYPIAYQAPIYGGGFGGNGGLFGGDFGALIALFFFAMMFGGFGGGWGMGGFGGFGGGYEFPWLLASNANNQNATQAGFNNAALTTQLDGIRGDVNRGFSDTQLGIAGVNQNICQSTGQIQNTLCQGFAGTTAAVTGAQNAITQQMYTNQIADMERSYAAQTASTNGNSCTCGCRRIYLTNYEVEVHANIQIPTGGTVEEIRLVIAVDGVADPDSIMSFVPAAVETAGNVGTSIIVPVPSLCGCESVAVVNASTQDITVNNASIVFDYAGIRRVR